MIILGIDPGIANTGYGVVASQANRATAHDYGNIRTKAQTAPETRLKQIHDEVARLITDFAIDVVALEEIFFSRNVSSALVVGEVTGIVKLAAANAGCPVATYTPSQVKQAVVGYGQAKKTQMQRMVQALLRLREAPRPDHAADALAVALCHARSHKVLELRERYQ